MSFVHSRKAVLAHSRRRHHFSLKTESSREAAIDQRYLGKRRLTVDSARRVWKSEVTSNTVLIWSVCTHWDTYRVSSSVESPCVGQTCTWSTFKLRLLIHWSSSTAGVRPKKIMSEFASTNMRGAYPWCRSSRPRK